MKSKLLLEGKERTFAVVFDTGDEVVAGLLDFARRENLSASHLTGLGAFSEVVLGFFDWETKSYKSIPVKEQVEVVSLIGDVALGEKGEPKLHPHIVVAQVGRNGHGRPSAGGPCPSHPRGDRDRDAGPPAPPYRCGNRPASHRALGESHDHSTRKDHDGRSRRATSRPDSTGPAPQMTSHETACILNAGDEDAEIAITVFFSDRAPAGPIASTVPARRTSHVRFNELTDPEPIPRDTDYASIIEFERAGGGAAYPARFAPARACTPDHHGIPGGVTWRCSAHRIPCRARSWC